MLKRFFVLLGFFVTLASHSEYFNAYAEGIVDKDENKEQYGDDEPSYYNPSEDIDDEEIADEEQIINDLVIEKNEIKNLKDAIINQNLINYGTIENADNLNVLESFYNHGSFQGNGAVLGENYQDIGEYQDKDDFENEVSENENLDYKDEDIGEYQDKDDEDMGEYQDKDYKDEDMGEYQDKDDEDDLYFSLTEQFENADVKIHNVKHNSNDNKEPIINGKHINFKAPVNNEGIITGASHIFDSIVINNSEIDGTSFTFKDSFLNNMDLNAKQMEFNAKVQNDGEIIGRKSIFNALLINNGDIDGINHRFSGVENYGLIHGMGHIFDGKVINGGYFNANGSTFNGVFINEDGWVEGNNNTFKNDFINVEGLVSGTNFIFDANVENYDSIEGDNFTYNKNVINSSYLAGKGGKVLGNFINEDGGVFEGNNFVIGEQNTEASFENSGLVMGENNTIHSNFINKDLGWLAGNYYKFNSKVVNENKDNTIAGFGHTFNGLVENHGGIYLTDANSDELKSVFNAKVLNYGKIEGNFIDFNDELVNYNYLEASNIRLNNLINYSSVYIEKTDIFGEVNNHQKTEQSAKDSMIYVINSSFLGAVNNNSKIIGSASAFLGDFTNLQNGYIDGENFTFNGNVLNEKGGKINGYEFDFTSNLKNYGTIEIYDTKLKNLENHGTFEVYQSIFDGEIKNYGNLSFDSSDIKSDIHSYENSTLSLMDMELKANILGNSNAKIDITSINNKKIYADRLEISHSYISSSDIASKEIFVNNSAVFAKINTKKLNAQNNIFILYNKKGSPIYSGFGGAIIAQEDIKGKNNFLKIKNYNTAGLDNHFVPLLLGKSDVVPSKDFFRVSVRKGLSLFGIDPKIYHLKQFDDGYYAIGIGNASLVTKTQIQNAIKVADDKLNGIQNEAIDDDFVKLANGMGVEITDENQNLEDLADNDLEGLIYIGADKEILKSQIGITQNQLSVINIIRNDMFKRLGDIKKSHSNGIWTRYYGGNISYMGNETKYASKSIGFDGYERYNSFDNFIGAFMYDINSSAPQTTSKSYGIGAYASFLYDNGFYLDSSFRYTLHNNDSIILDNKVKSNYYSIVSSVELGYEKEILNNLNIDLDTEIFYTKRPQVKSKIDDESFLYFSKANDLSLKFGLGLKYDFSKIFMVGINGDFIFDTQKNGYYGIDDGVFFYSYDEKKDKSLKISLMSSFTPTDNITLSLNAQRGFLSDFKLKNEINFTLRYSF